MTNKQQYNSESLMTIEIKKPIKINNFSEIDEKYDSIICDIWGVIHNGQELFKSSIECLIKYIKLSVTQ